jgi:hypothetical protein
LLCVNEFIRDDILTLLRFGNVPVTFHFELSNKAVHFNEPNDTYAFWNDRPRYVVQKPSLISRTNEHSGCYKMNLTPIFFAYLTQVTLSSSVGASFESNRPHRLAKVSARTKLAKQALSIRFIASHCPLLEKLVVEPYLRACMLDTENVTPLPMRKVKGRDVTPLVFALVEIVKKCKSLCTITIPQIVMVYKMGVTGERGSFVMHHWFRNEMLGLGDVEDWLRENVVEGWA